MGIADGRSEPQSYKGLLGESMGRHRTHGARTTYAPLLIRDDEIRSRDVLEII